jgi:tRNA(Ile)-lysidine synthase TilS/MesJ
MFRSRLDGAHNRLDTVSPPGFVAWSGGKDSTVAALIAVEHWGRYPPL